MECQKGFDHCSSGESLSKDCTLLETNNSKSTWKSMGGRWTFLWGKRPIFRGELLVLERVNVCLLWTRLTIINIPKEKLPLVGSRNQTNGLSIFNYVLPFESKYVVPFFIDFTQNVHMFLLSFVCARFSDFPETQHLSMSQEESVCLVGQLQVFGPISSNGNGLSMVVFGSRKRW